MSTYRDFQRDSAPPWLQGEWGTRWNESLGQVKDDLVDRAKQAVKANCPSHAPADALPLIGADRLIERGPGESDESFRARCLAHLSAWRWAGTRKGLLEYGLAPAGLTNAAVIENHDWATLGGVPPDGDTANWSRFWLVLGHPSGITLNGLWGASGRKWGAKATPWGSDASVDTITRVRRIVDAWRPAHARCVGVFVVNGSSTTIDTVPSTAWREPDATFGDQRCIFWRFP